MGVCLCNRSNNVSLPLLKGTNFRLNDTYWRYPFFNPQPQMMMMMKMMEIKMMKTIATTANIYQDFNVDQVLFFVVYCVLFNS